MVSGSHLGSCVRLGFAGMAVAVLLAAPPANAADCGADASQLALDLCALDGFQRADASLNALYSRMTEEPALSSRLARLQAAQRAWMDYRDVECRFEDSWADGGSMQPMLNSDCARALTERRIGDLEAALSCVHNAGPAGCRSP